MDILPHQAPDGSAPLLPLIGPDGGPTPALCRALAAQDVPPDARAYVVAELQAAGWWEDRPVGPGQPLVFTYCGPDDAPVTRPEFLPPVPAPRSWDEAYRLVRDDPYLADLDQDALEGLWGFAPGTLDGWDFRDPDATATLRDFVDGQSWLEAVADDVESVWGRGDQVLWADGEVLLIAGPSGVGKTTISQQLILGLLGLRPEVLGLPVRPAGRVLLLAMDRPRQARRSLRRMVSGAERAVLAERLVVWEGPLVHDLGADPAGLRDYAQRAGCDRVVVDSLKDAALALSDDATGSAVARSFQLAVAAGLNVVVLHHMRKPQQGPGGAPNRLSDVYGSTHIVNTAGSVVVLWGDAGDPVVSLTHVKQPAEPVGPWRVRHDHPAGLSTVEDPEAQAVREAGEALAAQVTQRAELRQRTLAVLAGGPLKTEELEDAVRGGASRLKREVRDELVVERLVVVDEVPGAGPRPARVYRLPTSESGPDAPA